MEQFLKLAPILVRASFTCACAYWRFECSSFFLMCPLPDDMVKPHPHVIMRSFPPPPRPSPQVSKPCCARRNSSSPSPLLFQMSGQGTVTFPNGLKYEGQFEAGQVDHTRPTRP